MKTPEGYEKDDIRKYLDEIDCYYVIVTTFGMGASGHSDIIGCMPLTITKDMVGKKIGAFFAIEVKREGKEPTKLQFKRLTAIAKNFGFGCWGAAEKVIAEIGAWRGRR